MKLLADENFPPSLISYLQKKRHSVKRIQRTVKGISDVHVREIALKENRIIITFDKDLLEENEIDISVMFFNFPRLKPVEITPFLDPIIEAINLLKRKKKPFKAKYSIKGLELII